MSEESTPAVNGHAGTWPRGAVVLCAGLAVLPFLGLCFKEIQYGLYFPYWDAWHFSLFLQKASAEGVGFGDYWAQHNEHRSVFPRLVMYTLASVSGWNVAWELAVNVLLGVGTFLLLWRMAFRGSEPGARPWWLAPALSFLVFSWVQMENWIWGWQIHVFLSTFAIVACAFALTGGKLGPLRFAAALCAGVVATFSFANGMLGWIALAPLVFLAPKLTKEARIIYSLLWVAAGVLVIQVYLLDYTKPGVSPSIGAVLRAPVQILGYFILYIGAPITGIFTRPAWHGVGVPVSPAHFIAGIVGVAALPGLAWRLLKHDRDAYVALLPWAGLVLYVLGSAALTSAGRAGGGLDQAMTSRYTTITTLYWCALFVLIAMNLREKPPAALQCPHRRRVYGGIAVVLFVGALFWSHHSQRAWEQNAHWKRMGWNALRAGHIAPLYLQDLCWDPVELRDRFLPILREGQWAGFGGEPYRPVEMADDYIDDAEQFMTMGLFGQAKTYLETALYLDEDNGRARELYGDLRALVQNGAERPDE